MGGKKLVSSVPYLGTLMKIPKFMAALVLGALVLCTSSMAKNENPDCIPWNASCKEEESLGEVLDTYCMAFRHLEHEYTFKNEILTPMKESRHSMDRFWTEPGCRPEKIGGAVHSPIVHTAAEDPSRVVLLEALRRHYLNERRSPEGWVKIVNAQSSKGHTVLDYVEYLKINKSYIAIEEQSVSELVTFICNNGGKNVVYSGTCSGKGAPFPAPVRK